MTNPKLITGEWVKLMKDGILNISINQINWQTKTPPILEEGRMVTHFVEKNRVILHTETGLYLLFYEKGILYGLVLE